MATLSTFRTEIASVLGLDTSNAAELALIDSFVNEACTDILYRTSCKAVSGTISVSAGTTDYTLDTAVLSIFDMTMTSDSQDYRMERVPMAEILRLRVAQAAQTSPARLYATAGSNLLLIYPTPSVSGTITYYYVPRPATLSATADTPSEIPSEWHWLVVQRSLWRGADYDDDSSSQMGQNYLQMYERGIAEMRRSVSRKGGHRMAAVLPGRRKRLLLAHDNSQYP